MGAIIIVLHFLTNGILMHEENASPLFFEPASPSFSGPQYVSFLIRQIFFFFERQTQKSADSRGECS